MNMFTKYYTKNHACQQNFSRMPPGFGAAGVFSLAAGFSLVFIFSSIAAIKTVFWRRFVHFYSHFRYFV